MRHLLGAVLVLGLAGCASGGLFEQSAPPPPPPPGGDSGPLSQAPVQPTSPAAAAAAPPGGQRPGELMDCVTQSCRINCAHSVKPQFRPKWCAQFKEPE